MAGFFRDVTVAAIEEHLDDEKPRISYQALDLYRWSHRQIPAVGVTVAAGHIWILEPAGEMYDLDREQFEACIGACPHKDDVPKIVPVRIAADEELTHVPTLLAQLTANRHLSSSTFKEIRDDFGNQVALDHVLFKRGVIDSYPTIQDGTRDLYHLLLCLGGNELIALVARLLEEHGLSVPAPTGGFVKNVDLFVYNDAPREVEVGSPAFGMLRIPPRRTFRHGAAMLQIRSSAADPRPTVNPEVDFLVQLNAEPAEQVLNHAWIADALRHAPQTRRWLGRILRWVPFSGTVLRSIAQ